MFEHFQILSLAEKHLIRILTRLKHPRPCSRVHLRHLLGHLAGGYVIKLGVRTWIVAGGGKGESVSANRTVFVAQEKYEYGL